MNAKWFWARTSVRARLAGLLALVVIGPVTVILLLEPASNQEFSACLGVYLAVSVTLWWPAAGLIGRLVVLADLAEINRVCRALLEGSSVELFDLPNETDHDHELLALKRNINFMVRSVAGRESSLRDHLQENVQERSRLWELSIRDSLTTLYNRRYFDRKVREAAEEVRASAAPACLMIIDVDNFKTINDNYGHLTGDRLLGGLGAIILASTRQDRDMPFRYGGDEFVVIFRQTEALAALEVGRRIRARYMAQWTGETSLSMGVAPLPKAGDQTPDQTAELWLAAADQAVYKAKGLGGDRLVLNEPGEGMRVIAL